MLRILFQGDSITDGNRGRNLADLNHVYGHGFIFNIVSQLMAQRFDVEFFNRGESGDRIANLAARWNQDTLELQPDVTSLLIGINDVAHDVVTEVADFERTLRELIAVTPGQFILAEPFTLNSGNWPESKFQSVRDKIAVLQSVVRQVAAETSALFLPLQEEFDRATCRAGASHWIWDSIHPTAAGHYLISQAWLKKCVPLLDKK